MKKHKLHLLLCSPLGNTGGISQWTKGILDYWQNALNSDIDLHWLYTNSPKKVLQSTRLFRRIYCAICNYIPFIIKLWHETGTNQYDIAHFATSGSYGLIRDIISTKICRHRKIKVVMHYHFGRIPEIFKRRNWEYRLLTDVLRRADVNIVMDIQSLNALEKAGYKNIKYVPNPLSAKSAELIKRYYGRERSVNRVLYVGHVVRTKGVFELVSACKDIQGIQLRLLGEVSSDIREGLIEVAGEGNERWLEICGNQPYEMVIREMCSCAIFTLPSYTEGFPNVIIESMSCGTPIIATQVGAIPEMLAIGSDTPCGICIPEKDTVKLKNAIRELLNDPIKAKDLGRRAEERATSNYSISQVWSTLENVWGNIG